MHSDAEKVLSFVAPSGDQELGQIYHMLTPSKGNGKIWPSADAKPLNRSSPNLKHVIMSRISTTRKN